MISTLFQFGGEVVEVKIENSTCFFKTQQFGSAFAPIEYLKLDKRGVVKEFPDLKDDKEWKKKAIKRFKEKLKSFTSEDKQMEYVIEDLKAWGYKPLYLNKKGHRPRKL